MESGMAGEKGICPFHITIIFNTWRNVITMIAAINFLRPHKSPFSSGPPKVSGRNYLCSQWGNVFPSTSAKPGCKPVRGRFSSFPSVSLSTRAHLSLPLVNDHFLWPWPYGPCHLQNALELKWFEYKFCLCQRSEFPHKLFEKLCFVTGATKSSGCG